MPMRPRKTKPKKLNSGTVVSRKYNPTPKIKNDPGGYSFGNIDDAVGYSQFRRAGVKYAGPNYRQRLKEAEASRARYKATGVVTSRAAKRLATGRYSSDK